MKTIEMMLDEFWKIKTECEKLDEELIIKRIEIFNKLQGQDSFKNDNWSVMRTGTKEYFSLSKEKFFSAVNDANIPQDEKDKIQINSFDERERNGTVTIRKLNA